MTVTLGHDIGHNKQGTTSCPRAHHAAMAGRAQQIALQEEQPLKSEGVLEVIC